MTFGFRMMNECGLQITAQIGIAFNFHVILAVLGSRPPDASSIIDRAKPTKSRVLLRVEHKQLAIVQLFAPVVVRDVGVVVIVLFITLSCLAVRVLEAFANIMRPPSLALGSACRQSMP